MTIRKFWKKLLLFAAAFFWTSCNDDSSTEPVAEPVESSTSVEQNALGSSSTVRDVTECVDDYGSTQNTAVTESSSSVAQDIESLGKTYCAENGGVTSYTTYQPQDMAIDSTDCVEFAKKKAVNDYRDSTGLSNADIWSCMNVWSMVALVYGPAPIDTATYPAAKLNCADGTTDTTSEYKAVLERYNQKKSCCEAQAESYRDDVAECFHK